MMISLNIICKFLLSFAVLTICAAPNGVMCETGESDGRQETRQDEMAEKSHQVDSLNLLIFVSLLIMTVLTIWMFKHIRLRYVHETGLAMIYGLIVGAIIKYAAPLPQKSSQAVTPLFNSSESNPSSIYGPPDYLKLMIPRSPNSSSIEDAKYYQYVFVSQIDSQDISEPELEEKATFDPEVFFNVLLPPIIFNAGYSMKRKHFFKNFGAIAIYAFLGTAISSFVVGGIMYSFTHLISRAWFFNDCLKFGAIISATDPVTVLAIFADLNVDVDLYALIFGESILNDAVAIVLVSTIDMYRSEKTGFDGMAVLRSLGNFFGVFFGAFALGCGMGCVTAFLTKYTHVRDYPLLETSLFFTMSYCTFLAAEAAQMTGIVAVLFCGICQAHYTYNNMSTESKARTKQIFELLNFLMENFVFAYIGVATFTFRKHLWNVPFILMAFAAIIIARFCNIYPLSFILNFGRVNKIRYNFQHMMMFSGLRGAMAFALAIRDTGSEEERTIFSTTLVIVMATIILSGGFTAQMLLWLKIRVGVEEDREIQSFESLRTSPSEPRAMQVELNPACLAEKTRLVRIWYTIDAKFVKPLLTHARPALTETVPKCCLPLARLLTTEQQAQQASLVGAEHAEDSDLEMMIDDHELNYGERNDRDHSLNSNSVFNSNHSIHMVASQNQRDSLPLRVKIPGPSGAPV